MNRRCTALLLILGLVFLAAAVDAKPRGAGFSPYMKSDQGLMVRVLVRYEGPERSPYLRQDSAGIALKEARQSAVRKAIQSFGGKIGYEFRHINITSATVPVSRLSELGGRKEILEITKDQVRELHFDPFSASVDEKKQWAIQKSQAARQRVAEARTKKMEATRTVPYRYEYLQQLTRDKKDNKVREPLRVSGGAIRPLGAGQVKSLLGAKGIDPANYNFYNIDTTHATAIWDDSDRGEGVIVAVIDSGTYSGHPLLSGSVIGAEKAAGIQAFEEEIDLDGDGNADGFSPPADSINNDAHGTGTACMIAAHGAITFPANDRFLKAIEAHAPATVVDNGDGTKDVLLFGSAPDASIYAIKAFPYDGGGAPSSITMAAMDRVISLRERYNLGRSDGLNIQVVSMSFGGPGLFPGFGPEDRLAEEMVTVGMQPVISSGNSGPAPFTVSEPGSSLKAITVGAASEPRHNRISFELAFPQLAVGAGRDMVPSNRMQIADFSSRGPLATGFAKPDVVAEGDNCMTGWLFDTDGDGISDTADVAIVGGTSFSTPTTSGVVALLTKFASNHGLSLAGQSIKGVLLKSARHINGMQPHQEGLGYVDAEAAAAYWIANPGTIAGSLSKRKDKYRGEPYTYIDIGSLAIAFGTTDPLEPGEQSDFLIPMETSSADQAYFNYFYVLGLNRDRSKPFPAVVRDIFDPDLADAIPPFAATKQNTEIYYAEGINTGFSDGDYIIGSLNQVDTSYFNSPNNPVGFIFWYPDFFPALTTSAAGYVNSGSPFFAPVTNIPSGYAQGNPHMQMGSGGFADFDRFTFLGDVTNETGIPVDAFWLYFIFRRSDSGLTTGTPSLSGTIKQNQVKVMDLNLPVPVDFYQFHNTFNYGWNNYKFTPPWTGELPAGKRKAADLDFLIESPSGALLNTDGFPGFFQGATLNDVEMIHDLSLLESGNYVVTVIGFDVKGVPGNTATWEVRVWDGFVPIIP